MSEFKFSCPNCQQNISATPEHSGTEVVCPKCQTPLVVPSDPSAPPPPKGKLSKAASTVDHAAQPTSPIQRMRPRKKLPVRKYATWAGWAAFVCLALWFGPKIWDKYQQHRDITPLAKEAETNGPPPPPPELTAQEILKRTGAVYKALNSYSGEGDDHITIDMSKISPTKKPQSFTAQATILLSKPDRYKITWEQQKGSIPKKGETWSDSKGDFVKIGALTTRMKNRDGALGATSAASGSLSTFIVDLFFDETNSIAADSKYFSRTNSETLAGQKCYVVDGSLNSQNVFFWINREDFTVVQAEILLGGNTNDPAFANLPPAQKAQRIQMAKLKGSFIETYQNVQVNKPVGLPPSGTAPDASAPGSPAPAAQPNARPRRPRMDPNNPMSHIRSAPP